MQMWKTKTMQTVAKKAVMAMSKILPFSKLLCCCCSACSGGGCGSCWWFWLPSRNGCISCFCFNRRLESFDLHRFNPDLLQRKDWRVIRGFRARLGPEPAASLACDLRH
ncbi:hypothetical protein DsansV1_C06g0060141 [Dioscorea sansibarensis]